MNKKQYQNKYRELIRNKSAMQQIANDLGLSFVAFADGTYGVE